MKLLRCRKCGTVITTQDAMVENMLAEINKINDLAIKASKNKEKQVAALYMQQSAQLSKLMKQIIHIASQLDESYRRLNQEKGVLVHYLFSNNLITEDKLHELEKKARERAAEADKKDQAEIERLYGDFCSICTNRTKSDPTANRC